jgi:hypothetical protein
VERKKLFIFVKKLKMILNRILKPSSTLNQYQGEQYFKGSGCEDEELNFINDKPWILYLPDEDTKTFFERGAPKNLRLSLKQQILNKLNLNK